jgi:hypothetical protein
MTRQTLLELLTAGEIVACSCTGAYAQSVSFAPVGSIMGPADVIKTQGSFAYIAGGKTLTIVDISHPEEPKRAGAYTFPSAIWGFTVVGAKVYVAADVFGLAILDVSNGAVPTLLGSIKTPGQAKNVALFGTRALVADHVAGIDVVDVSTPTIPTLLRSFFVEGFAKDVIALGSVAYAIDMPNGFYVFDLSKPDVSDPVSTLTLASAATQLAQLEVSDTSSIPARRLAVVVGGGGPLQVYDVSDMSAPVHATTYRVPGGAGAVALKGSLAYTAGREGLQVVDLGTPSQPTILGAYQTAKPARGVAVTGSLVLVGIGNNEVLILRQSP